jgi:acyl-CoA synthetase (NDP forming)
LAGSRRVWEGALRQAGVISVASFEEALDCLYAFHLQPLPKGRRVGIISGPGGTAVSTTDRCLELGLEVPQFSRRTTEKLHKTMPLTGGSINNPIDLSLASMVAPHVVRDALRIAADDENIDMLLVITVVGGERFRDLILEAMGEVKRRKPLAVTVMAGDMQSVARDFPLLLTSGISVYSDAVRAAKALARLSEYAGYRRRPSVPARRNVDRQRDRTPSARGIGVIDKALKQGRTILSERESKDVLRTYAIPVTREKEIHDEQALREALREIGFPAVIKACGPNVTHKTERGLVHLDARNQREAGAAFKQIINEVKAAGGSVLVQEMIKGSRELVAGFVRDEQFGPCVMFGLGGIYTEILQDIVFRVAPIEKAEALEMIDEMKARKILDAFRTMPATDIDQLADILVKVGNIGLEQSAIKEIDINPIIVSRDGPVAVDALILLVG